MRLTPDTAIAIACPGLSEEERSELYSYMRKHGYPEQPMIGQIEDAAKEWQPVRSMVETDNETGEK
jgi:hypothetical protein